MPFVPQSHREKPDGTIPGDICYLYYVQIMEQWRKEPRWTTIDTILSKVVKDPFNRAFILAFMVFFSIHGMPYEEKQRAKNGDV
jgi:hypothetical protein